MKPSKDFEDACMMLSAVILILVSTSNFSDQTTQHILMGGLGLIFVVMAALRIAGIHKKDEKFHYE